MMGSFAWRFTRLNRARSFIITFFVSVIMFDVAFYITGRVVPWPVGILLEAILITLMFVIVWWVAE